MDTGPCYRPYLHTVIDECSAERRSAMRELCMRFVKEEEGLELLEYAILAVVLAVALAAAYNTLSDQIGSALSNAGDTLNSN
jgi:Flp pilus assembly pilin Flp